MDGASTPSQPPPSPDIPLADLTRTQLVQIYNLSDREAWSYSDEILCAAALSVWPSIAYRHFTTTLVRHYLKNVNGALEPHYLEFKFICRYQPDKCKVGRKRKSTGDGTSNLRKAIKKCDKDRMAPDSLSVLPPDYIPYSQLMFRVLLIIWCVVNYRPFQTVSDPAFLDIVHMLRPEAIVPTPHTLSSDLTYIYNLATLRIREVFLGMDTGVHLAIDGWSSPLTASFLGVVVFWRTGPTLWRSVLEFIHLTESHTGSYLAEKTLECLDRFGLRHHIVSVCLDNASNNNTLVQHLALSLPNFPGTKAYMAVFTRPPPRKRRIAQNARVLARQSATNSSGPSDTSEIANRDEADLPPLDELDVALEIPGELIDEGMEQHDTIEVQNAVGLAVEEVANTFGLRLSDAEIKEAREVFPKAAGFANQIHGSGTLYAAFVAIRNQCKDLLTTQKEVPTQRVVTRWGADLACARTHGELRPAIDAMTSRPGYKLGKFQMSPAQWEMLDECVECLEIFEEPTHIHSQSNTALVHEVIPHLLLMKFRLGLIRDAIYDPETEQPLRLVSRVAAVAAIHVVNKYLKLLEAADIYWLAIGALSLFLVL
ncbi:Putative AC transposase [Rhizoctonia solani]|uniref:Putative AC transposase n=1 Tax=Rhizoctonia solani TaxID=456999 RepID=A0A0K6GF87_9AGAM|nr:Putative AC transposase [Rhizoctonia solani]